MSATFLDSITSNIDTVLAGQGAGQLLERRFRPSVGHIVTLPSWVWRVPKIDIGKKALTADGAARSMPVRVLWQQGPVQLLRPNDSLQLDWSVCGLGHVGSGRSVLAFKETLALTDPPEGLPPPSAIRFNGTPEYRKTLVHMSGAGVEARWDILLSLESLAQQQVAELNRQMAGELSEFYQEPMSSVLDDISLDDLVGILVYGGPNDKDESALMRMVGRALAPDAFARVDPARYFVVNVRARAEELMRRRIGDPKIGPKVRRVLQQSEAKSMSELLAAYQNLYPKDSLGAKRAAAALSTTAEPSVSARPFDEQYMSEAEAA